MNRETNVKDSAMSFGLGFLGIMIVVITLGIQNFRIEAKDEVRMPKKVVQDSVKYTCPHCAFEVSLTTNN